MAHKVTPWEVKGQIDYDKLIKEFGLKHPTVEQVVFLP